MTPEEVKAEIATLDEKLARIGKAGARVARSGVNKGIKVLAKAIQAAAPLGPARKIKGQVITPGALRASIQSRGIKASSKIPLAKAGIDVGKTKGSPITSHGHWVALGTAERETGSVRVRIGRKTVGRKANGKKVRPTGRVTANAFVRRASTAAEGSVLQAIIKTISAGIEREATKQG